jgi:hypothetical protein
MNQKSLNIIMKNIIKTKSVTTIFKANTNHSLIRMVFKKQLIDLKNIIINKLSDIKNIKLFPITLLSASEQLYKPWLTYSNIYYFGPLVLIVLVFFFTFAATRIWSKNKNVSDKEKYIYTFLLQITVVLILIISIVVMIAFFHCFTSSRHTFARVPVSIKGIRSFGPVVLCFILFYLTSFSIKLFVSNNEKMSEEKYHKNIYLFVSSLFFVNICSIIILFAYVFL